MTTALLTVSATALIAGVGCGSASADAGLLLRYEATQEGRRHRFVIAEQGNRKWLAGAEVVYMSDGNRYAWCRTGLPCLERTKQGQNGEGATELYISPFLEPNGPHSLLDINKLHPVPAAPRVVGGQPSKCKQALRGRELIELCVATHGGFLTLVGTPHVGEQQRYVLRSVSHQIPTALSRLPSRRYTGVD
jgi:hypothetical protein